MLNAVYSFTYKLRVKNGSRCSFAIISDWWYTYLCRTFWYHSLSTSSQVHDTNWGTSTVIRTTLLYIMQCSFVIACSRQETCQIECKFSQVLMQPYHLPEGCVITITLVLVQFQGIMKPLWLLSNWLKLIFIVQSLHVGSHIATHNQQNTSEYLQHTACIAGI